MARSRRLMNSLKPGPGVSQLKKQADRVSGARRVAIDWLWSIKRIVLLAESRVRFFSPAPPNERGGGESSGRPVFLCRHRSASANGLSPLDAFASYRHQEDPVASPADRHSARHPTPAPHSPAERHPLPPVNGHSHSSGRSSSSSHSSSHRSSSRVDSPPSAWLDTKSVNPPLDSSGQSARLLSAVSLFCVHHLQRFIPPDQV